MLEIISKWPPENDCILHCCESIIVDKLIYRDVYKISEDLIKFLSDIEENSCLGLMMTQNIYVPCLIFSCLKKKYTFMFLNENHESTEESVNSLGIKWIVTMNMGCKLAGFETFRKLKMRKDDELILYIKASVTVPGTFRDTICIYMTSGTTGKNKLVQVENYCIESNVKSIRYDLHWCGIQYYESRNYLQHKERLVAR